MVEIKSLICSHCTLHQIRPSSQKENEDVKIVYRKQLGKVIHENV